MRKEVKVAVIGAGAVGSTTAYVFALRGLAKEVALIDINAKSAEGKARDLQQSTAVFGIPVIVKGGGDYTLIEGSRIVVITAGVPRKPHQKREETLTVNAEIMKEVIAKVKKHAPDSLLIIVSNPLDAMTWLAAKESGVPKKRVIGMAGTLDTARYKAFIAERLKMSPSEIDACVLGGHGDLMVPLSRLATASGKPVRELIPLEELETIEQRTRLGGGEIVDLVGTSAWFAPAAAIFAVVEAIVTHSKQPVPVSAWLEGEYGLKGLFLGVPCLLSEEGVEKVVELPLNEEELAALRHSAESVKKLVDELR